MFESVLPRFSLMLNPEKSGRAGEPVSFAFTLLTILISLIAIAATFLLAVSDVAASAKAGGFVTIVTLFLMLCLGLHFQGNKVRRRGKGVTEDVIDRHLLALEDASEYFAGSLAIADSFRLIASRVRQIAPCEAIALYLLDTSRTRLELVAEDGTRIGEAKSIIHASDMGIAARCYRKGCVTFEQDDSSDDGSSSTSRRRASIAVPLLLATDVFGILKLSFKTAKFLSETHRPVFEAIGTRAAPLILSSVAFERSRSNALTDPTTELPNERAYYLILENQIAEAQRKTESRPLAILAMTIDKFDEINQKNGHAAGDRMLNFVAEIVKENLRQMDFFARSTEDEFLAVLPTADREVSHEIIARLHAAFFGREFRINDRVSIEIALNIGLATFGPDGETPAAMLEIARQRRDQPTLAEPPNLLWFPNEIAS